MKHLLTLLLISGLFISSCQTKRYHEDKITVDLSTIPEALHSVYQWQNDKNQTFKDPELSPLLLKDKKSFESLRFYEPSEEFQVDAAFEKNTRPVVIKLRTNTQRVEEQIIYGWLKFQLEDKEFRLAVYQNIDSEDDYLFLPFADQTSGFDTYGGGRYIDLSSPLKDSIQLDFNKAYNPYCVYNKKFSCPLVPEENYLEYAIRAGELNFKSD